MTDNVSEVSHSDATIIYTRTDEAPLLATYSLLPIIQAFTATAGVAVETRDISLAGRIIAQFPDRLTEEQRQPDALAELGELAKTPEANIIKLPNISASVPQLKAAIAELQSQGYDLPDYPDSPQTDEERTSAPATTRSRAARSTRCCARATPTAGRRPRSSSTPAATRTRWAPGQPDSKTNVAHMTADDFRSNETSATIESDGTLRIELVGDDGNTTVLRESVPVLAGEVVDATAHACRRAGGVPRRPDRPGQGRGRAVLGAPQGDDDEGLRPDHLRPRGPGLPARGLRPLRRRPWPPPGSARTTAWAASWPVSTRCPRAPRSRRRSSRAWPTGPALAMVDSDRGITNLHVPSDVIVDASMPAMIRTSGHMWGPDGEEHDTLAVIPDSCYAGIYQVVIDDCRAHGAYDPTTMGSVPNVGLMAQAAEEYGSHDKTFEIPHAGTVRVVDEAGTRAAGARRSSRATSGGCARPRTSPIRDWVKLAVTRARATGDPGRVLAGRRPGPRRPADRQGRAATCPSTTPTAWTSRSCRRSRRSRSRWSGSAAARTPSRSPATCCATT